MFLVGVIWALVVIAIILFVHGGTRSDDQD